MQPRQDEQTIMMDILRTTWSDYVQPLLRRPNRFQVAALCHREHEGRTEVLLITSRDTGRWVIPKGWPMEGFDAAGTAVAEAWEEAGVRVRRIDQMPLGTYRYRKRLRGGAGVTCETKVFRIEVESLSDDFPQKAERTRCWVTPQEAAGMVQEPELRDILQAFPTRREA